MRLDHFLPFPARARKNRPARQRRVFYNALQKVFPAFLFTDSGTRKIGVVRRVLKRLGPTWLSSPIRRAVQSGFFLLFLWLFFYVCWPYRATPPPVWRGWIPVNVDISANRIQLERDSPVAGIESIGSLYVTDESDGKELGSFNVINTVSNAVLLTSQTNLSAKAWEELSFRVGPWSLSPSKPGEWPTHYADEFDSNDRFPAEFFLIIDPLVSLSTFIAAKSWVWSLAAAACILLVCVVIPRGFCGYVCPLGTLIDLFDWAIGKRVKRFRVTGNGWWVHLKYFILAGVLVAALMGVLLSGLVSAIPVITRGLLFTLAPIQDGLARGWHQVPPLNGAQIFSIVLFLGVLALGFLQPRFWCKYVCPSGAVFSLGNLFRATERKVEDSCIHCNKCVEICPFDAIKPDFTTRTTDCTLCQTCGGVCPTHAIKFVERTSAIALKPFNDPPTREFRLGDSFKGAVTSARLDTKWLASFSEAPVGRRGFLASSAGLMAGIAGGAAAALVTKTFGAHLDKNHWRPIRPPGSVPEKEFLELCIRCGECFKVCPNNVLQPLGFQQGLEGFWSPQVAADWAGCEPSCNACGNVCPTGAIRPLPMEEKKVARMGLARVNEQTCLPIAGREACQLCVDECSAAGYHAIDFIRVHTSSDENGVPIPGSGFLAPKVQEDKCVGCGLCQMRCFSVNAKDKHLLNESAIIVEAGDGKEDRIMTGSYIALKNQRNQGRASESNTSNTPQSYLPEFLK
ncbi:MAG: 4Fe-4S binding protein [Verrucomicrobia bacterium]|nr:4Fe-4S binding protein [Verrucomicrobiota bacterium]